ncbi:hypothetical protein Ahy_B08g094219 [Arachis hypogaea]|uniref:FAR1 domain-containing protein n=1 Tax=Arachis hypogaea TaxID=3818 RepID=A0A444Y8H0_ARAHY|nr:hypothetical protein Ahy_B08g094219 [Arachis hypogaea]
MYLSIKTTTSLFQYGVTSILSISLRILPVQRCHDHRLLSDYVPTGLVIRTVHRPTQCSSRLVDLRSNAATRMSSEGSAQPMCAFFPMSTSQDEGVSSVLLPLRTSPSRSPLMECDMIDPLGCVLSTAGNENSSNLHENVADHFVVDGEQSNKAMQLSDVTEVGSEEMDLGYELPDHDCLQEDEIPRVEIRFAQLQMAHEFYVIYAKKVGFATKIRTTTCDKITKKHVNQAIHYNRDGFCGSRVKAPTQKSTISAARCKARIYVKFEKDIQEWILFKVELRHSHPYSARKAVHYHEYRELTMHAKCVIEDNDEAVIRPNKTFLALTNEAGGPSNLGFSEKDLRNYITARLRTNNVNADVREMMNYFMRMTDINPNFF